MTIQTNGIYTEAPKPERPPLDATGQPWSITITLTTEDLALLDEVGKGNYSEGVRLAIRTLRTQRAELQRIMARLEADPSSVVTHDELQHRLSAKSEAHLIGEVRTKKAVPHVLAP
ncbi:MAG: hypothetical protein ACOYNY_08770 [Caldilineaceae bacterium]